MIKKLGDNRPGEEIKETFQQVKDVYKDLIIKHDEYTEHIAEEEAFEQEERWLEECQGAFLELETKTMDYPRFKVEHVKPAVESGENGTPPTKDNQDEINNGNQDGETGENETETVTDGNENLATKSYITPEISPTTNHNVSVSSYGNTGQGIINEVQSSG